MELELTRIKSNNDKAGTEEQGNFKSIKAPKNHFLWKVNCVMEKKIPDIRKEKIVIEGIIGRKKFTASVSPIKLQPISMY